MILRKKYLLLTLLFFVIEVCIALFIKDKFIRPYLGDVLVVVFMYCFVRSFFRIKIRLAILAVLLFSYLIEVLQYFNFVSLLNLEKYRIAKIVLGSTFSWGDLICYTVGALAILAIEEKWKFRKKLFSILKRE